jgi:hypothetical protein
MITTTNGLGLFDVFGTDKNLAARLEQTENQHFKLPI